MTCLLLGGLNRDKRVEYRDRVAKRAPERAQQREPAAGILLL
jgi:hypothetical protein